MNLGDLFSKIILLLSTTPPESSTHTYSTKIYSIPDFIRATSNKPSKLLTSIRPSKQDFDWTRGPHKFSVLNTGDFNFVRTTSSPTQDKNKIWNTVSSASNNPSTYKYLWTRGPHTYPHEDLYTVYLISTGSKSKGSTQQKYMKWSTRYMTGISSYTSAPTTVTGTTSSQPTSTTYLPTTTQPYKTTTEDQPAKLDNKGINNFFAQNIFFIGNNINIMDN